MYDFLAIFNEKVKLRLMVNNYFSGLSKTKKCVNYVTLFKSYVTV